MSFLKNINKKFQTQTGNSPAPKNSDPKEVVLPVGEGTILPDVLDNSDYINLFPPNTSKETFVSRLKNKPKFVGEIYYPYYLTFFSIDIKRYRMKPRRVYMHLMCDAVSGEIIQVRSKEQVEFNEVKAPRNLIDKAFTEKMANEKLADMCKRKILRKYRTWWLPVITAEKTSLVYIKYWVVQEKGAIEGVYCNSFDGKIKKF